MLLVSPEALRGLLALGEKECRCSELHFGVVSGQPWPKAWSMDISLCEWGGARYANELSPILYWEGRYTGCGILRLIFLSRISIFDDQMRAVPGGWGIASSLLLPFRSL